MFGWLEDLWDDFVGGDGDALDESWRADRLGASGQSMDEFGEPVMAEDYLDPEHMDEI